MKLRKMSYFETDADGKRHKRMSSKWYAVWQDFSGQLRRVPLDESKDTAQEYAGKIDKLNKIRGSGDVIPADLAEFIRTCPPSIRDRLAKFDVIEAVKVYTDQPLAQHVDRWEADLTAKGNAKNSVVAVVPRVQRIIKELEFVTWADLNSAGAATKIKVWLGTLRAKGEINGSTVNKYIGDVQHFCRWLAEQGFAPRVALTNLELLENDESDSDRRRALSIAEMHRLVDAAAAGEKHHGLTGDERAILYRFAFETGMRPGQMATLTVANFKLTDNPPTVTTQAQFVKRRTKHEQVLRPELAADLQKRFTSKMPSYPAFKLPDMHRLAEMIRDDAAVARQAWIKEAKTDQDRIERAKSDFLANVNHAGERLVFYSCRHGHGTALADAGVPEKDIAKSMHHASRTTTERYMHSDRSRVSKAIDQLPDLSFKAPMLATGTDGKTADSSLSPSLPPLGVLQCPDAPLGDQLTGSVEDSNSISNIGGNAESPSDSARLGQIAQLVEQWTENPCVVGSIPTLPIQI
jgi:integrase